MPAILIANYSDLFPVLTVNEDLYPRPHSYCLIRSACQLNRVTMRLKLAHGTALRGNSQRCNVTAVITILKKVLCWCTCNTNWCALYSHREQKHHLPLHWALPQTLIDLYQSMIWSRCHQKDRACSFSLICPAMSFGAICQLWAKIGTPGLMSGASYCTNEKGPPMWFLLFHSLCMCKAYKMWFF